MNDKTQNNFEKLAAIDISKLTEPKPGVGNQPALTYLSWADAWEQVNKVDPEAAYKVHTFDEIPYIGDPDIGYMVFTEVTIFGRTLNCHLPVLNSAHKALKKLPYKYTTKYGEKSVNGINMADINKAIMRCIAKNIALHGLGINLYTKEDLTDDDGTEGVQPNGNGAQNNPPNKPSVSSPAVANNTTEQKICPICSGKMYMSKNPDPKSGLDYYYCINYKREGGKCKYSEFADGNKRTDVMGKFI